ncbi:MAG: hypothetical protein M1812_002186 [Candelaria pacifica]|nr:MAG: hypothetical protein M1812_002186 [Candelaria pacifica]
MGAALLRVSKLQDKWRVKLAKALESKNSRKTSKGGRFKKWAEKYAMFLLPFITVLREGLEAVVFIGGVALGLPATAIPLAVVTGLAGGCLIGFLIYKGGNLASIQIFLIVSTCFLYLVAAGLFSKAVWLFEMDKWNKIIGGDASETGAGPGSYDLRKSVWHVNCCSPDLNGGGGWGIFNSLFGWQNSATIGSVVSYNLYWVVVIIGFLTMRYSEKKGHWPFLKRNAAASKAEDDSSSQEGTSIGAADIEKTASESRGVSAKVRSTDSQGG